MLGCFLKRNTSPLRSLDHLEAWQPQLGRRGKQVNTFSRCSSPKEPFEKDNKTGDSKKNQALEKIDKDKSDTSMTVLFLLAPGSFPTVLVEFFKSEHFSSKASNKNNIG